MGSQSVLLTCLFFLGQAPGDPAYYNRRTLPIPMEFEAHRRAEIKEVLLYASSDYGKNWQQVGSATPDKTFIPFNAAADGPYWLTVAAVNRSGKQEPANIRTAPPALKFVIDTMKPLVRITGAQREGEEVVVSWDVQENAPDWASFRVEWQAKDGGSLWNAVSATPGPTGHTKFRPSSAAPISVRVSVKDLANNAGFQTAEVAGGGVLPAGGFPVEGSKPLIPAKTDEKSPFPPPTIDPIAVPGKAVSMPKEEKEGGSPWIAVPPKIGGMEVPKGGAGELFPKPVATSEWEAKPPITPATTSPVTPPPLAKRPLPPVQYFNSPNVPVQYELSKVGPAGIGSIDLYWTRDEGKTWEKYADDPSNAGSTRTGRFERMLKLDEDGVYGLTMIITSKAGLGKAPPRAGEAPQMMIEIDTKAPTAQLYPPVPDASRPNTLLMRWKAEDKNLDNKCVSLEWSETREGPWQPIGMNLANTGHHPWTLPESIPVKVHLRLRVRDAAGNEAVAVTNEPQIVDLTEPEGRLVGISPPGMRP